MLNMFWLLGDAEEHEQESGRPAVYVAASHDLQTPQIGDLLQPGV